MAIQNRHIFFASLPAALVGVWNLGAQTSVAAVDTDGIWQFALAGRLGVELEQGSFVDAMMLGAVFWLPLLAASVLVGRFWSEMFSRKRGQRLDPGWLLTPWLFSLLLPVTMPLGFAALALSFGLVFGSHVFGGSGKYLVNPAVLALVFAMIAYPDLFSSTAWLPGASEPATWAAINAPGDPVIAASTGRLGPFLGVEIGALGATSALASICGAVYLIATRTVSAAIVAGGVIGLVVGTTAGGALPWTFQLAVGNFAFVLGFIATDPTTRPRTGAGCWTFGALFGALTILLRTANPDHPEGSLPALLLASLCIPLIDYIVASWATTRRDPDSVRPVSR